MDKLKTATINENDKLHGIPGRYQHVRESTKRPIHQITRKQRFQRPTEQTQLH